jgi:hypothetical protein
LVADQGELDVHFGPGGLEETVIQPAAIDVFVLQAGGAEHYVAQLTGPALGENFRIGSIAVSGFNGDLVVSAKTKVAPGVFRPGVYLYRPEEESPGKGTYVLLRQLTPPDGEFKIGNEGREPQAFAVDNSNGEIYVATRTQVYQFSASGASLGDVAAVPKEGTPSGHPGEAEEVPIKSYGEIAGLAVDPASGRLFVRLTGLGQNQVAVIDVLGPDVVVPDVATESPTNLRLETDPQTSATSWALRPTGTLNPLGEGQATCSFAWGTSPALGHSAPCSATIPNGTSPVRVHAALTGLAPDTTYYYRLQAENHNGTNSGEESQTYHLTTPGPGPRRPHRS